MIVWWFFFHSFHFMSQRIFQIKNNILSFMSPRILTQSHSVSRFCSLKKRIVFELKSLKCVGLDSWNYRWGSVIIIFKNEVSFFIWESGRPFVELGWISPDTALEQPRTCESRSEVAMLQTKTCSLQTKMNVYICAMCQILLHEMVG